jgi:hypothetical protein
MYEFHIFCFILYALNESSRISWNFHFQVAILRIIVPPVLPVSLPGHLFAFRVDFILFHCFQFVRFVLTQHSNLVRYSPEYNFDLLQMIYYATWTH